MMIGNHFKPAQTSGDVISGVVLCANLPIINDRQPVFHKGLESFTATVDILKNNHTVSPEYGNLNLQKELTGQHSIHSHGNHGRRQFKNWYGHLFNWGQSELPQRQRAVIFSICIHCAEIGNRIVG